MMEEAEAEEGLCRVCCEELAALREDRGVRGVRAPSRCARLEEGSVDAAREVSILRCETGIPGHSATLLG